MSVDKKLNLLTGIKDLDREILNKMSDRDFLQMCILNRTYYENVCSDDYFRIRTENGYPETIPYKDYVNKNEGKRKRSWKNHYLNIVKYIDLLERKYEYIYKKLDKSPELLYLSRQLVPSYEEYTKNEGLLYSARDGHLSVVKYLIEMGANIHDGNDYAIRMASENGHLSVVEYLVEHGANVNELDSDALNMASSNGYLSVVEYLVENGADIHAENNYALRWAAGNGHLSVVEYLVKHGADIHALGDVALRVAVYHCHLEIVKYLVEHGANIDIVDDYAIKRAIKNGYLEMGKYLKSLKG